MPNRKILVSEPVLPDSKVDPIMITETKSVRVLIADDFIPFLDSLTQLVGALPGLEAIGAVSNGEELLALCEKTQPDVVLTDIQMPFMDGVTATKIIKQRWPRIVVIGLTGFEERERTQEMINAGASLCLSKSTSASELLKHVSQALNTFAGS